MIASSLKGKLMVFAVFFLGIATGVAGLHFYETRTSPENDAGKRTTQARRDVTAFHEYLGLNADQREQVRKIMEETRSEFRKLAEQTRPEYEKLNEQTRDRIRALLTEEQKKKYDEFRTRQQERRGQRSRPN